MVREPLVIAGTELYVTAVTVGNPHCVVHLADEVVPTEAMAKQYGPLIEVHSWFPNKTNVQFMSIMDRSNIR